MQITVTSIRNSVFGRVYTLNIYVHDYTRVLIWWFSKWLQVNILCAYVYQNPDVTQSLMEKRS